MKTKTTKAQKLLNKVYNHLEGIDITNMSMRDLQEFVEVLQKAHFLESAGQNSPYNFGGFGGLGSLPPLPKPPAIDTDTRPDEE